MYVRFSVKLFFFLFIFIVHAAQAASIRFNLGGAKFTSTTSPLSISITVDTLTPTVTVGTAADQSFRDDSVSAAFFGYYLTAGVRTAGQGVGTVGNVKVRAGASETSGRSFYLLGNGTTTPTLQSQLTAATATYTTFGSIPRNGDECGTSYATNGVNGVNNVTCSTTDANLDITQFVKVLFSDPPSAAVISQLDFAVVEE